MENIEYSRRGYLHEDFRLFHLKDNLGDEAEYHYHEFDKAVIFISGRVNYMIEGVTYPLRPWDVLLISNHIVHKALIDTGDIYERAVIYINPDFAEGSSSDKTELRRCFKDAESRRFYLLRPDIEQQGLISSALSDLERELSSNEFGSDISSRLMMLRLLVQLNRSADAEKAAGVRPPVFYDPKIASIITYINDNLDGDLTIDALAARTYVSKYHFMRRFKELTGYTVHNYILQKRLISAADKIKSGAPAAQAAVMSGFKDYSTFQRAFKKMFGVSPAKMK